MDCAGESLRSTKPQLKTIDLRPTLFTACQISQEGVLHRLPISFEFLFEGLCRSQSVIAVNKTGLSWSPICFE